MIGVLATAYKQKPAELVLAALRCSVSRSLSYIISPASLSDMNTVLAISPDKSMGTLLLDWLANGPRKLIIFGDLTSCLATHFGCVKGEWPERPDAWSRSADATCGLYAESAAHVQYEPNAQVFDAAHWCRPLERFDFTDEWNNLGYGAIRADGSIWSLSTPLNAPPSTVLAQVMQDGSVLASYAALFEEGGGSILWINREVGLIDSFEWRLVERFISNWRHEQLPCLPVISEIPWGCNAAITMRLDCDEDISSARPLWEAYREMNVPLSLAIHTSNFNEDIHHRFLRDFCEAGGCLLSHTATHAPYWGGSYEAALKEGIESRDRILNATGVSVDYAVSPFHQSPHYALQALCDAGYRGCIGGIIRNDPEFLSARGGERAGLPRGFVGHSQQTMLHGDCMLADGDPLSIFKAAFDRAYETRTLFGYLDHPFSARYQYGWADEASRIQAHRDLISYIRSRTESCQFMDENSAMNFLRARTAIQLHGSGDKFVVGLPKETGAVFAAEYRGNLIPLADRINI
jgi:hypothetical protein